VISQMLPTVVTYAVLTASPGPGNMAIGAVAARHGRRPGLTYAAGLLAGGFVWAVLAATGVSTLLVAATGLLTALKILCAAVLFWLAWKSMRTAFRGNHLTEAPDRDDAPNWLVLARRGFLMQVSNPKAVITWTAVMAVGLHAGSRPAVLFVTIGICEILGMTIFAAYALMFSIGVVARGYRRAYRWVEGALGIVFTAAGIRLLTASRL